MKNRHRLGNISGIFGSRGMGSNRFRFGFGFATGSDTSGSSVGMGVVGAGITDTRGVFTGGRISTIPGDDGGVVTDGGVPPPPPVCGAGTCGIGVDGGGGGGGGGGTGLGLGGGSGVDSTIPFAAWCMSIGIRINVEYLKRVVSPCCMIVVVHRMRMLRKLAMRMRLAMRVRFIKRWLWFNYLAVFMDSVHAVRFRMPINFTVFFIDIMVMPDNHDCG